MPTTEPPASTDSDFSSLPPVDYNAENVTPTPSDIPYGPAVNNQAQWQQLYAQQQNAMQQQMIQSIWDALSKSGLLGDLSGNAGLFSNFFNTPNSPPQSAPQTVPPPSSPGGSTPSTSTHQELLNQHNQIRQQQGLGSLTLSPELTTAATAHAQNLANGRYRSNGAGGSHTYGGTTFSQRARSAGYTGSPANENWAMQGSENVSSVMNMWMNSSGHRAAIVKGSSNEVGFGVVRESGGGTIHFVSVFGRR